MPRYFVGKVENDLKQTKGFFTEFREFISRGSMIDLAVDVIIGGAFTAIVTSLVNDIVMPAIGILFGGIDFTSLRYVITPASGDMAEAAIYYGRFIQNIINFLLIALVIFTIIRIINKFCRKKEESIPEPAAVEPSEEAVLLREIRDLISRNEKWHSIK